MTRSDTTERSTGSRTSRPSAGAVVAGVGLGLGATVGEGDAVGSGDGEGEGDAVGDGDGDGDGLGGGVGDGVGASEAEAVSVVGAGVGGGADSVGVAVGDSVAAGEGAAKAPPRTASSATPATPIKASASSPSRRGGCWPPRRAVPRSSARLTTPVLCCPPPERRNPPLAMRLGRITERTATAARRGYSAPMSQPRQLPYGSWPSPVSVEMVVAGSVSLREPRLDGEYAYWIEGRPAERGRQVIVRWHPEGGAQDVTPPRFNARSMVHEYGGGAYTVHAGIVYFSNLADGRVYRHAPDDEPQPMTPAGAFRYADFVVDVRHGRLLCIREDHSISGAEPRNELVALPLEAGETAILASGDDFYSTPRPSPDGSHLSWLSWSHPNMPWDASRLWLADVDQSGQVGDARVIDGGADESIVQPEWGPDGSLCFVSDRSGWWSLYRLRVERDGATGEATHLTADEAEYAGPQWVFGMTWYGFAGDGSIVAAPRAGGRDHLRRLWPTDSGTSGRALDVPETELGDVRVVGDRLLYIGASPTTPNSVVLHDLATGGRQVLRSSAEVDLDPRFISVAEPIIFPTANGLTAHALFYRPTNPDFAGPPTERPPLVVMSHGGPTSAAWGGLDLEKQLFTSRGLAVVDVDYGGSVGYGRQYMRRLDGAWGIVDVEDCVNAARHLAERGEVDAHRMAITGGSAGGFTTLCALIFHAVFACGASHYGVGDLEALARDTHKFESRYLDRLIGRYPEEVHLYRERSPIHSCHRLERPLIVLQGTDDMVVPVAQAEALVGVLREREIPHAYLLFEGEGHGFRQAHNIRRALEAELSFYAQVFGFELADAIEPVEVAFRS
jgi:dipeptidyl aminopeptidase/acylaminoacyl peptidase